MELHLLFLSALFVLLVGCSSNYTNRYALYTSDKKGYSASQIEPLLDEVLEKEGPTILFVHGRGSEPKKSLQGGTLVTGLAVHKLEKGYGSNVVMFSWDSEAGFGFKDRTRPLSKIDNAVISFSEVLEGIQNYKKKNPQSEDIALIVHSMGNIVVETYVRSKGDWISNGNLPLFSNVILSSPDSDDVGHAEWVEKISAIDSVYVTINKWDKVLNKSYDERDPNSTPMGLEPGTNLAPKAVYIDLSEAGENEGGKNKRHENFDKRGMYDQVYVCTFFHQALTGQPVILNNENSNVVILNKRYKLKYNKDGKNICFRSKTT